MKIFQYLIKGQLYDKELDLASRLEELASNFNIEIEIEKNSDGFFIETKSDKRSLLEFEPRLLRKLATYVNISIYTKKEPIDNKTKIKTIQEDEKEIKLSALHLRQERIIAIKGDNGFHLVCNASKAKAVQTLRKILSQPTIPLSVMFKNIQRASQLIQLSKKEIELLESQEKPTVISKIRNLHRLEKVKYKHKLTPLINPINQRVALSLIHNNLYEKLFKEIEFPLVSIDVKDKKGNLITNLELLSEIYGEYLSFVLSNNIDIKKPKERKVYQIVYGKPQLISPKPNFEDTNSLFKVVLDYNSSEIGNHKFKQQKILLDSEQKTSPNLTALSLLFAQLTLDKVLEIDLPFSLNEIKELHKNWQNDINIFYSNSIIHIFDALVGLSNNLDKKSFIDESWMFIEAEYEVCEEDLFDYQIIKNEIEIDLITGFLKNNKLKYLGSTLVNTISTIIAEIAKNQNKKVFLIGEMFHYRDLSELTIEKLEDEGIEVELL